MDEIKAEDEIKEYARKIGAAAVGIASVEDVNRYAPSGHRPDDILRGAKSVIVVGCGTNSAGVWRAASARVQASTAYSHADTEGIARKIVQFIERKYGHYALACPGGLAVGRYPYLSMKLLAEMSGLGSRSMAAGIILNGNYGLLYYGGAITTMPLKGDGSLSDPVCPHPSCSKLWEKERSTPCLQACPTCLSGELEGGRISWMEYRQDKCLPRAQTTAMDVFKKMLLEAMDEPDSEKRKSIILGSHFTRAVHSLSTTRELFAQCFECVRRCPVVRKYRQGLK